MSYSNRIVSSINRQCGLSIVEIMISLVIGATILAGAVQIVSSSKRNFTDQEEIKFIQTNARFAMDVISKDLRMAGYVGCATQRVVNTTNTILDDEGGFVSLDAITGFEGSVNRDAFPVAYRANAQAGADSILIRHASTDNELSVRTHNPSTKTLTVWDAHIYGVGSTLVITDANCRSVGLFHASSGTAATSIVHNDESVKSCSAISTAIKNEENFTCASGCPSGICGLPGAYSPGSKIMELVSHAYYIGSSSVAVGIPALKRQVLNVNGAPTTTTEEIALGVEHMQIIYGYDSSGDGGVDQYRSAGEITSAQWVNVINVKLNLVFRSSAPVLAAKQSKVLAGVTFDDRYIRQLITATVQIRNRG